MYLCVLLLLHSGSVEGTADETTSAAALAALEEQNQSGGQSAALLATGGAADDGYLGEWGLVGADGTEDGFAVIGSTSSVPAAGPLVTEDATATATKPPVGHLHGANEGISASTGKVSSGSAPSMASDHVLVDELMRRGRGTDTGPSYSGARRAPGAIIASARVILVGCDNGVGDEIANMVIR